MSLGKLKYPLDKVRETVHKWLYLEDDRIIDVIIATHIANQLNTDPTWLLVIGPPSHTKTELLRAFEGHPQAHFLSSLTPQTLVSGHKEKNNQPTPSLLPKLNGKTLVLKDFTSILSMRSENQQEVLSQLREIYDGHYTKAFGTGKVIDWKGHVGLLGACTPVYDKHYGVIGSLGDRFLLYRTSNNDDEQMGMMAQKTVGHEQEMRQQIRQAFHTFIGQFNKIERVLFEKDPTTNQTIVTLACFCAYGRCPVERHFNTKAIEYDPMPEGPARLVKQFMQIGMALALISGKDRIDGEVYEIIKKIGRDLLPARRLKILQHLWDNQVFEHLAGWEKNGQLANGLRMPPNTVKLTCEDMMIVGLLERIIDGETDKSPYQWQLNQKAYDFMKGADIFEVTTNEPY